MSGTTRRTVLGLLAGSAAALAAGARVALPGVGADAEAFVLPAGATLVISGVCVTDIEDVLHQLRDADVKALVIAKGIEVRYLAAGEAISADLGAGGRIG